MSDRCAPTLVQDRLGLGCSRLGSVLGIRGTEGEALIKTALDRGIRFFDTASIYGQGESEQILGRSLRGVRDQVMIATKAGQYFPAWTGIAKTFKATMAPWLQRTDHAHRLVARARAKPLPQNFSDAFLRTSIENSLRRLQVDCVDILLLHSPPSAVVTAGDAVGSLRRIRDSGKARRVGVSCDDLAGGLIALEDPGVEVIELPMWPWSHATDRFAKVARERSISVIARGLLGAAPNSMGPEEKRGLIRDAMTASRASGCVDRVIFGTTRAEHLAEVIYAVEDVEAAPCT
jgi:aryl-alcohol dehydrogenase-like predicted oxidoreductase